MDELQQVKYNYTREIEGPDGKKYTARKDPRFSFWTIWRGSHQYPGKFTSLSIAKCEVINITNKKNKKPKARMGDKHGETSRSSNTKQVC